MAVTVVLWTSGFAVTQSKRPAGKAPAAKTAARKAPARPAAAKKTRPPGTKPKPADRTGSDVVARVSAEIKQVGGAALDINDVHVLGHPSEEEVRSLAHIYTPWGDARSNGSGVVALAAWAKRLEEEGMASTDGRDLTSYIRGLIHR